MLLGRLRAFSGRAVLTMFDDLVHICYDALDPHLWPYCSELTAGSPAVHPDSVATCLTCIALEAYEHE